MLRHLLVSCVLVASCGFLPGEIKSLLGKFRLKHC